jgi:hypothetical protein
MIGAAVRFDGQAAVGPQLSLAAEAVRRLQNRNQLRCANRTDRRNLAQQFRRLVLGALGQQFAAHLLPQRSERIELLVVNLRAAANTRFAELAQPLGTTARRIDLLAGALSELVRRAE